MFRRPPTQIADRWRLHRRALGFGGADGFISGLSHADHNHEGALRVPACARYFASERDRRDEEQKAILNALRRTPAEVLPRNFAYARKKPAASAAFPSSPRSKNSDKTFLNIERLMKKSIPIPGPADRTEVGGRSEKKKYKTTTGIDDLFQTLNEKTHPEKSKKTARGGNRSNRNIDPKKLKRPQNPSKLLTDQNSEGGRKDLGSLVSFFDELGLSLKKKNGNSSIQKEPERATDSQKTMQDPLSRRRVVPRTITDAAEARPITTRPVEDMFIDIPKAIVRGPNDYEAQSYDEYEDLLNDTVQNDMAKVPNKFLKFRKKLTEEQIQATMDWLNSRAPVVETKLPRLEPLMKNGFSEEVVVASSKEFEGELKNQKERFIEQLGWVEDQYRLAAANLLGIGHRCAKKSMALPLEVAWQKIKEMGHMDKTILQNYMYASSTFSTRNMSLISKPSGESIFDMLGESGINSSGDSHLGNRNSLDSDKHKGENEKFVDVAAETATCHDLMYEPSEASLIIRVRMLVENGNAEVAERVLDQHLDKKDTRLRTLMPIYSYYIENGEVASAMRMYKKMKNTPGVIMLPETFVQIIACIAENGYFNPDAEPIDGMVDENHKFGSGPRLFDQVVSELAMNFIEISNASAKRLYSALQKGCRGQNNESLLKEMHLLEPLALQNEPAAPDELIVSRSKLDKRDGRCPRSGSQLRLIGLDQEQKKQLQSGLQKLAAENSYKTSKEQAVKNLDAFSQWLNRRPGKPFTAIIDGANVGYYMQNFVQGTFNFHQIQFVVDALEKRGENALVILPHKYSRNEFTITKATGYTKQKLTDRDRQILDGLSRDGKLYVVPPNFLDDMYWMFASVSEQQESTGGKEIFIPPDNREGRWAGLRPILISNDQMRDHHLELLEPRLFARWKSNCIVNFNFSAFVFDRCQDAKIAFSPADIFSREIQGNPSKDEHGNEIGTAWHFPVRDWEDDEALCIRLPYRKEE